MATMEHDGYLATVDFDQEAGFIHGQVITLRDVITFQGRSVKELKKAFRVSVEDYLEFCRERSEEPEKPFSGNFLVRLSPDVHRTIAVAAAREQKSLNKWASETLERAAEEVVAS